jgi:lipopolysaccharide biosynthesis protein
MSQGRWQDLRAALALWIKEPGSRRQFARALRYHLDKNASRFVVQVVKQLPSAPAPAARKLVFFAHYDPQDEVDPYVVFYLRQLRNLGCEIIFVSGSPWLKPESAAAIRNDCAGIYTQHTLSLDFGCWNLAWQQARRRGWTLQGFDQLILANDSVYGPLFPLGEIFSHFNGADLCGVTESLEGKPHLQSYFLAFNLNDRTRKFVEVFWSKFRYVVPKLHLIQRYEIGLSQQARTEGLELKAYISSQATRQAVLDDEQHQHRAEALERDVNSMLYLWDILISRFRCPFLKTDLPKYNRYGSRTMERPEEFLRHSTEYDPRLIENHLRRLGFRRGSDTSSIK